MVHEILQNKKLSEHQKKILSVISDSIENNYILEVFDIDKMKTTFTVTNGEDDYADLKESTMKKLWQFNFIFKKILPSSDRIIRMKHFIPKKFRHEVFKACL